MKNPLLLCMFLFMHHLSFSQAGEWTFMCGDSIGAGPGNYGIQGVPSVNNKPPAFYEACEWTDLQGNFWMYGGLNWGVGGSFTSAMWKYDPVINMWTWIQGPTTYSQLPVYGVQGVSAPTNTPGNRGFGACTFTDTSGNLWLMNGYADNFGNCSSLWKYDIGTNEWTWVSGPNTANSTGVYGTQGIPSINNSPNSRSESVTAWTDSQNNFWTFGGLAVGGNINDLWRYTPATNEWTWMRGSSTPGAASVFGTKGLSSPANMPGARSSYSHWIDGQDNLWFFGGGGNAADLWRYNTSNNEFTWMSGINFTSATGNYGALCTGDVNYYPSTRVENKACWTDSCGNFWMMGGTYGSYMNDLWKYSPSTNEWMLVYGDPAANDTGIYGVMGVSSPLNRPPARNGTSSWKDLNGNFWMFGGYVSRFPYNCMGDLWRYVPDPACGGCVNQMPLAQFAADNHVCPGTCTEFDNLSVNATSYLWTFNGANPATSTDASPVNICYNTPGTYSVSLIASNSSGSDTLTLNNFITVYPFPPPQGILQNGDTLFANPGAVSYQWYENGTLIPGATDYFYVALQSGNYNVVATDENDCEVEAAILNVIASVEPFSQGEELMVQVFPNPAGKMLSVTGYMLNGTALEISIYNMLGKKIVIDLPAANCTSESGVSHCSWDISALSSGTYFLHINDGHKEYRAKFMKE